MLGVFRPRQQASTVVAEHSPLGAELFPPQLPGQRSAPVVEGRKGGLVPPYAVIACSAVFFWSISIRVMVYTVMPTIANDLRLSSSAAGLAIAGMLLGYCAGSWLAGRIPASRKNRILGGILLSLLGTVLFSMAGSLEFLLGAGVLLGLGTGVYLPLGLSLVVEAGGTSRGAYYLSLHEIAATAASFTGASSLALILLWTDWQGSLRGWCGVGLLALLAFAMVRDDGLMTEGRSSPVRSVPFDWRLIRVCVTYGVSTLLVMGLISMLPLIMVRAWGVDQAEAASVVGSTRLAGALGVIAVGLLGDRWGHIRVLIGLQSLCVIGLLIMSLGGYGSLFSLGLVTLAAGASGYVGLAPALVAAPYPATQKEQAMVVANAVGGFMGLVIAPALFGVLIDLELATGPLLLALAAAVVSMVVTSRSRSGASGGD